MKCSDKGENGHETDTLLDILGKLDAQVYSTMALVVV